MTTVRAQNVFYVGWIVLAVVFWGTLTAKAQTDSSSPRPDLDLEATASTTSSAAISINATNVTAKASTPAPWFTVDKLTGDNLAQGDFVVGPGRVELEIKPGQAVTTYITVANRISDDRVFELTTEDMKGTEDASQSVVLLGSEHGPYTVKDYISFPETSFVLDLGERARIPVTITIPPNAEPGGFYGSVLVSTLRTSSQSPEEVSVRSPIIARIGTLFFITVPGKVDRSGELKDFSLNNAPWWYEKGPIDFKLLYENTGSVHTNPYGEIRIKNIFNEEVGFVEIEPWFSLPKSLRTREVSWDRELLFGRYTATAAINRGYADIVDTQTLTFWVLPWKIVGTVFLVVFILLFGIRFFFRTFEFKRKN